MDTTMSEVVQFIQENDVKFIRLAFCDIFGNQKNIAIQPTELTRAFEYGIHFNASALRGFLNVDASDLLLFPDPATLSVLPWRPAQGRVVRFYCDIRYPDGTPFEGDGRYLLRQASRRARKAGYSLTMCTASEFYLFELDENGHPTTIPHDHGEYFDVAPLDKAENVRRQICLTLEEMNIQPESSHHEQGPGQNEVDFRAAEALEAADNFVTFKWVVKSMASSSGLYASFLPKPLQNTPGSGLHLAVSITKNGQNLFHPSIEESEEGRQFVAGVLRRAAEMTIFGNPLTNSFQRLGEFEAPKYITWSHQNRAPLITVPLATGGKPNRFKLRSFDGCINPYIVFALLIHAGLDGIEDKLELAPACEENLFTSSEAVRAKYDALPESLCEAIRTAQNSDFIAKYLPEKMRTAFSPPSRPSMTASRWPTTAPLPSVSFTSNATETTERRGTRSMERFLVVSSTDKSHTMLAQFLVSCGVQSQLYRAKAGSEARRALVDGEFDLVLVNTPLPDEFGHELAQLAAGETTAGVILLAKAEIADSVAEKVEDDGVFVVPKPLSRVLFMQALRMTRAARSRLNGLQNENRRLQKRIEDIRLVDRAKCLLIECCGMSEPEAHSYIEQQAMNRRCPKRDVAQGIIDGDTP